MDRRHRAESVLEHLRISPSPPNTFYLGSKAIRLTFLSQQHRAFNLIWALIEKNLLGTSVAVVGGGLAGMTAALAAQQAGAEVTLYERKGDLLHLQRGCQLRFIHPNVYDWPDPASLNPFTRLPCLNWGADMAVRVVETILMQWEEASGKVRTLLNHDVRSITELGDGRPHVVSEGSRVHQKPYDCVVVAVGFGLERTIPLAPFLSYWENDNFGRPIITGPIPRRYLVTGCGDGGLIDAARLRIKDFDHARFVNELLGDPSLSDIKKRLPVIDKEANSILENAAIHSQVEQHLEDARQFASSQNEPFNELSSRRSVIGEIQSLFLYSQYEALDIPELLQKRLKARLREDTTVTLNSPEPTPLSLRASILNRFVTFLLRKYGGLRFEAGLVKVLPDSTSVRIHASFHRDQFPDSHIQVEEIVVRHGVQSEIERLFPKSIATKLLYSEGLEDPTCKPCYPGNFLQNPVWSNLYAKVRRRYAIENLPGASNALFQSESVRRFGLQIDSAEPRYFVDLKGPNRASRLEALGLAHFC